MNAIRGKREICAATPSSRVSNLDEGFTGAGEPPFVPFRECDCPEWVDQCAHFDGHWIALHISPADDRTWVVCRGEEPIEYLKDVCGHWHRATNDQGFFTNLIEARSYFYAAEEALLATAGRGVIAGVSDDASPVVANESASFATQRTPAAGTSAVPAPARPEVCAIEQSTSTDGAR